MTLTIDLSENESSALAAKAQAQGVSAEQYARSILERDLKSAPKPRRHISEVIRENVRQVPAEILDSIPADGASQHDHYIYGVAKRNV